MIRSATGNPGFGPLQPADWGIVSIEGGAGLAIRLAQFLNGDGFANYEHVLGYLGNGKIAEAEPGGARIADISEYAGRQILWSSGLIALTAAQRTQIVATATHLADDHVGYSAFDYDYIAMHRLHIPGQRFVKGRVENSGRLICSQFWDFCYQTAGVQLWNDGRWVGDVTPGDFWKLRVKLVNQWAKLQ